MLNKSFNSSFTVDFFKKLKLPLNLGVTVFFLKNQKILIFKKNNILFYFICPIFYNFFFNNSYCFLIKKSADSKKMYYFLKQLNMLFCQLTRVNFRTYFIRGTGLKINLLDTPSSVLNLRIGYSHIISLPFSPTNISISIFKKKIIFCGFNKVLLGNFTSYFYKYRPINIFTGKGFLKKQKKKIKLKEYTKKL